jgi:thiamine-monophosphate kinase
MTTEFALIDAIARRAATRDDVVLGIGDDAAILAVPRDRQLVVAMDTLNAGVHFPDDTAPAHIGWKALAVNLSDLAAMGARPAWCTLSLSLPASDSRWLEGFLDGFLALAARHGVALVGGDTTRGPLSVCVTAHGLVVPGGALRRDGALVGDDVWVTGTLGDAAGALAQWRGGGGRVPALRERLDRPLPRVEAGLALAGLAHAAIDVSDGLLADLGHVCAASGVGAEIELGALPVSPALAGAFDLARRRAMQCTGGDDYELCFSLPRERRDEIAAIAEAAGVAMTRIGRVVDGDAVVVLDDDGNPRQMLRSGFDHFPD